MNGRWRRAEVFGSRNARELEAYLPSNFKIEDAREEEGRPVFTIAGEDEAGWTLDGYVIPRLASGLISCRELEPEPHTQVEVDYIPPCDLCGISASFDAKTKMGPWGYLCKTCFEREGIGLGLGLGQRLIKREEVK